MSLQSTGQDSFLRRLVHLVREIPDPVDELAIGGNRVSGGTAPFPALAVEDHRVRVRVAVDQRSTANEDRGQETGDRSLLRSANAKTTVKRPSIPMSAQTLV